KTQGLRKRAPRKPEGGKGRVKSQRLRRAQVFGKHFSMIFFHELHELHELLIRKSTDEHGFTRIL
ncbi:MAG TPA: hypothetical protein DCQ12_04135, partial [Candidatus Cloacimonas sp.]|nr:hypothetical protein [Candidatus Cloacimonas sp.]